MTLGQSIGLAQTKLRRAGINSASLDAELLMTIAIDRDRTWIHSHLDDQAEADKYQDFEKLVDRRVNRMPLDQIIGYREFYGLRIKIGPTVLSPRTETEPMVELAIKNTPDRSRLIDIGTGCGALAIAIAKHRPDLHVTATDRSPAALKVAGQNIKDHDVRVKLIESDLFKTVSGRFHTVVANLPYLRNDADLMPEARHEPRVALLGGPDGLDLYRGFFDQISTHLESDGRIYIEADPWQHAELTELARSKGLKPIYQDYFILGFRS